MPQGIATVIPGATIEASWGNAVADRIIGRFATTAERDAAITTPTNGMVCYVSADHCLYVRDNSVWVSLVVPRRGVVVSHTGQSVAAGGTASLAWDVENYDPEGFHVPAAAALVVPTGMGGVYAVNVHISGPTASVLLDVSIRLAATTLAVGFVPLTKSNITVATVADLAAGSSITCQIYNGNPGSAFFAGTMRMFLTGP